MLQPPRAALSAALLIALGAAAPVGAFQSPSHNIACGMFDSHASGAFVRCDIAKRDWALPPRPHNAACRELDFEGDVMVTASGKGHFICAGDTLLRQGAVLHYGHSRTVGRFRCTMRTSGVTCTNRRTHHGFVLSRQSYRFF